MSTNNTQPNSHIQRPEYEVQDVDSPQDKKAAALVQSILLKEQNGGINMNNNGNEQLSAQDILALQAMQQQQQQQQQGGMMPTLMTGAKYAAIFGAGFLGAKLFFNGSSSKDTEGLFSAVSDLFD